MHTLSIFWKYVIDIIVSTDDAALTKEFPILGSIKVFFIPILLFNHVQHSNQTKPKDSCNDSTGSWLSANRTDAFITAAFEPWSGLCLDLDGDSCSVTAHLTVTSTQHSQNWQTNLVKKKQQNHGKSLQEAVLNDSHIILYTIIVSQDNKKKSSVWSWKREPS